MRRLRVAPCVVAILAIGGTSRAGDRLGVGIEVGTLGVGVDLTGRVNDWFSLRGSLNQYNYSHGLDKSGIHYDADLKLGASGVLADFYPLRGRFRLTGGALSNRNKFDLKATPTSDVTIGNNTYTPAQVGTLRGDIRFRSAVPYFGIGFGNAAKGPHRVGFAFDLGLMPQGRPRVGLTSSTGVVSSSDLQKEQSKISDDSKNFKFWPVLAVGLSFRI